MTRRDWSLIAALAVLWGSAFILIEIGLRSVPPNTLVFARMALAVPPLLLLMRMRGAKLPNDAKSWAMLSVLGLLNVVLPFILFYWGMTQISTGLASILNATTPLWGVVAAHFLTRDEKATPARIIGVLFGVAGIAVMIGVDALSGMTSGLLAQIACLIATLCYALASIYARKFGTNGMAPLSIATGQVLTSAIIMLPIALISDAPWTLPLPGASFWLATGAIAVFSTSLAYYLYFQLLESAGASNSLLVTFLIPIVAVLLGAAFLGERFSLNQGAGVVLISVGLVLLDGRVLRRAIILPDSLASQNSATNCVRPDLQEIYTLLANYTALIVHFSGTPPGSGSTDDYIYPKDLQQVVIGNCHGGLSCSTVMPNDVFHDLQTANATGCVGVILGIDSEQSIVDVSPHDCGSYLVDNVRIAPNQRDLSITDIEHTIQNRQIDSYNEWIVAKYVVLGIFAAYPFNIWASGMMTKYPDEMPINDIPTEPMSGIAKTDIQAISNLFPNLSLFTFINGKLYRKIKEGWSSAEHSDLYRMNDVND